MPSAPASRSERSAPTPIAVSVTPDRSLQLLGAYVRTKKPIRRPSGLPKGTVGVVVRDVDGKCKSGQVAVRVPGLMSKYVCLPSDAIGLVRPK